MSESQPVWFHGDYAYILYKYRLVQPLCFTQWLLKCSSCLSSICFLHYGCCALQSFCVWVCVYMSIPPLAWYQRCHSPRAAVNPGWRPVQSWGSGMRRRWMRWTGAASRPGRPPGPPSVALQVHGLGQSSSGQHYQAAQLLHSAPEIETEE